MRPALKIRRMCYISFDTLLDVRNVNQKDGKRNLKNNNRKTSRHTSNDENRVPNFSNKVSSDTARQILEDIRNRSLEGKKWVWLLKGYTETIEPHFVGEVLTHLANEESVFTVFKWASKQEGYSHTVYSYNCLIGTLVRCGSPWAAYRSFQEMVKTGYTPDDYSCTAVLRGFCKAREPEEAYSVLKEMASLGIKPSVGALNVILQSLCDEKSLRHAISMLAKMKVNSSPNAETYNILIKAMSDEKRHAEAEKYYQEMIRGGIQPNFETYSLVVEAYCKGYRIHNAASIVKEMVDKGHKPSLQTYKTLMFANLKNWKPEAACEIFRLLQTSGYDIDASMYQGLVDGLWTAGLMEQAHSFLREMAAKGFVPSEMSYSMIIKAKCIAGKLDQACQVYDELIQAGHFPDVHTCVRLIKWLAHMDKAREAFKIYEKMIEKYRPNEYTFHAMLWCLCRAKKILLASMLVREVLNKFKNFVPMTASFNCLMAYYCCVPLDKAGSESEMGTEAEADESESLKTDALDLNKAVVYFQMMIARGRQPNEKTFWILICGLCKADRQVDAYKLFKMIREFQQVPDGCIYELLIGELCKVDMFPEAEYVFDNLVTTKKQEELMEMENDDQTLSRMYGQIVISRDRVKKTLMARLEGIQNYHPNKKHDFPVSELGPWHEDNLGW